VSGRPAWLLTEPLLAARRSPGRADQNSQQLRLRVVYVRAMTGWWRRIPWSTVALLGWCLAGAFGAITVIQRIELRPWQVDDSRTVDLGHGTLMPAAEVVSAPRLGDWSTHG
jgi:hypothetical protein